VGSVQGQVKQIIGGTLDDTAGDSAATENFVSTQPSSHYARMYRNDNLTGGHVIILGQDAGSIATARAALAEWPRGLQLGGGVTTSNAMEWLDAGADKLIVTSFAFAQGQLQHERLDELVHLIGRSRLVLDLSCRKKDDGQYYVVTDRWQKFSNYVVRLSNFQAVYKQKILPADLQCYGGAEHCQHVLPLCQLLQAGVAEPSLMCYLLLQTGTSCV
jgi:phosphoribosylformimino-5-aminoimidazole carboxamide ribotide isomerase